jgi:dihydrofolate synthase/folylpolyglutamate synthase
VKTTIDPSSAEYLAMTEYLLRLKRTGVILGLDRMQRLVTALGHPEKQVPCIHIAGTNGKGSVAAMIEAIFRAAGWRTGLYTSPHLVRLGERIQVDRQILSPAELVGYVKELQPVVASLVNPDTGTVATSYFEFMTAMAFLHFARKRCDVACIEVGLGGRLDATNVVLPEISVITSIGLDHCDVLGDTLAKIAAEKGGIIKAGKPLVIGRLPIEAEEVIRRVATDQGSPVFSVREAFGEDTSGYPHTMMAGDYQRWNAGVAMLVAQQMDERWGLTDLVISRGLLSVDWPGRWQRFSISGKTVIVDCSHNAEGAETLERNLEELIVTTGRQPVIVAGVLGLSRARPLVEVISRFARQIHFVQPQQSRACTFEELKALVPVAARIDVVPAELATLFPAENRCAVGLPGDTIVVTGSIYLAGEVLARIDPTRGPVESQLQDF